MGGLARISDDDVKVMLGRIKIDHSIGGTEPMTGWFGGATFSDTGGATWNAVEPEIRLLPTWTEFFGGSSPIPIGDGRLLWTVSGTVERDAQWQAGVTTSGPDARDFTPITLVAAAPDRDYSDIDAVRLRDGRLMAVVREHLTLQSVVAVSDDEGVSWSRPWPTPFQGSNIRLWTLRSGGVVCAFRDEDPNRRGVSLAVTDDGGRRWTDAGQLYSADLGAAHVPGSVCGYPDMVDLGDGTIGVVLHTYPSTEGTELHWLRLRDRT